MASLITSTSGESSLPVERDPARVDAASNAYIRMAARWGMIDDLLGGTDSMRLAGKRWLAQETKEEHAAWAVRLSRSFLYPMTRDTLEKIVSRPFSRAVVVHGDLPAPLDEIEADCDLRGTTLTEFARKLFREGVAKGQSHVFVDFPPSSAPRTLADERDGRLRAYFAHVKPADLIGYRAVRLQNGSKQLAQVRIKETRTEPDGDWGETDVDYIRVWTAPVVDALSGLPMGDSPGAWHLYRKDPKSQEYGMVSEDAGGAGTHTFPGVPLRTFYSRRVGFLESTPPLEDLAWLNIQHWMSSSDQRNLLRYARAPILGLFGFTEDDASHIVVGPLNALRASDFQARAEYVEHSGAAIGAGQADIDHIEEQGAVLGMQPFMRKTGQETATGKSIDESRAISSVHAWATAVEATLEAAYRDAATWHKVDLPDDFRIDVFREFDLASRTQQDVDALLRTRAQGSLTTKSLLTEMKRRALLSDTFDVEEELLQLEAVEDPIGFGTGAGGDGE